jgi:hypothetical protein
MQLVLAPGVLVLTARDGYSQVGLNPNSCVLVRQEFAQHVLRAATAPTEISRLLAVAESCGIANQECIELLNILLARGLLIDQLSGPNEARHEFAVEITNGNKLGLTIATLLIADRNIHVALRDKRPITANELLPWGPFDHDLGKPREQYFREVALRHHGDQPELPPALRRIGVVVSECVGDFPWLNPRSADHFMARDIPHFAIGISTNEIMLTQVIRPGSNACLQCIHEHESDRSVNWPIVMGQLVDRVEWDYSTTTSIISAAEQAINRINEWIKTQAAVAQQTTWLHNGHAIVRDFDCHSACGCSDLSA